MDKDRLSPGQRWRDVIRSAIRSGNFFIACFSGAYWSRDQSFMNEELAIAVEQLRRFRSDRSWFIPVLLSPCVVPELPIGGSETLQDIQHVDLGEDWNKGVAEIARVIRSESGGPTPAPAIAVRAFMSRHSGTPPPVQLRAAPRSDLGDSEVVSMIKRLDLFEKDYNPTGVGIQHSYVAFRFEGGDVVLDSMTGLAWAPCRYPPWTTFQEAVRAIDEDRLLTHEGSAAFLSDLNMRSFGSFRDWRLPTIEEALSLVELGGRRDWTLGRPNAIWTSDKTSNGSIWVVGYINGDCGRLDNSSFWEMSILPVRTWLP